MRVGCIFNRLLIGVTGSRGLIGHRVLQNTLALRAVSVCLLFSPSLSLSLSLSPPLSLSLLHSYFIFFPRFHSILFLPRPFSLPLSLFHAGLSSSG